MFKTISSTKVTQLNVQEIVGKFGYTGSYLKLKLLILGNPIFCTTKTFKNRVNFLRVLINLNKKLILKPYPMPKINVMLLELEGFSILCCLI